MITAASIISRSASGSAYLPNSDSTCQRRASQPSTWSVIAGDAEDDRRRPAVAAVRLREQDDEDRDRARTARSSARSAAARASGDGAGSAAMVPKDSRPGAAAREPGQSAVAERLTLPGFVNAHSHAFQRRLRGRAEGGDFWAWREAMLAEAERQTPETVRARVRRDLCARCAPPGTRRSGEFHYLGLDEALRRGRGGARRRASSSCCSSPRTPAAASPASARSSPADYLDAGRDAARPRASGSALAPHSVRACPADWLEEIGRYASRRGAAAPRPRRRAAARDRGVPRGARRAPDRAARPHGLPRPADDRRPRDARETTPSSTCSRRPAHASASARRPRRTSATASRPSPRCARAGSASASAPTRTSASTRSRSCASSTGSPAGATGRRERRLGRRAARVRLRRGRRARSASTAWPGVRGRPRPPLAARRRRATTSRARSCSGCGADVFVELGQRPGAPARERANARSPERRAVEVRALGGLARRGRTRRRRSRT